MPPYYAFRDPDTGETFTREMTDAEFAAFPDPTEVLKSSTPQPEATNDVD